MRVELESVLENLSKLLTKDDGSRFIKTERLDRIKQYLDGSKYEIMEETPLSVIYKKKDVVLPDKIVLLSSHVDCVEEITEGGFECTEEGTYAGTFDNAATNAAIVIAMIENQLSDNVIVAFTGDEENNSNGAKQVKKYLKNKNIKYIAIALDLTYNLESEPDENKRMIYTYEYASYTIDNIHSFSKQKIVKKLFNTANKMGIKYMVTRADGSDDYFDDEKNKPMDYYDAKVEVESTAYEDEAIMYGKSKNCIAAFSLCLPSDDTEDECRMHTNKSVKIKREAFDEYIEAVAGISKSLSEAWNKRSEF